MVDVRSLIMSIDANRALALDKVHGKILALTFILRRIYTGYLYIPVGIFPKGETSEVSYYTEIVQ